MGRSFDLSSVRVLVVRVAVSVIWAVLLLVVHPLTLVLLVLYPLIEVIFVLIAVRLGAGNRPRVLLLAVALDVLAVG